jgi:alpha-methylacyl-CoA racemase
MSGALEGIRIIEMAGIGPAPFCGMMLADHGAEVIRIERASGQGAGIAGSSGEAILNRSRRSIALDLKQAEAVDIVRAMARRADGLIEGFRPGVMERLGLGPDILQADNPRLVFGRMTGWGQTGPYAAAAGHDINYIALAGSLHGFGRAGQKPTPPGNVVGDFGGGGMLLAFGMLAGLLSASRTGRGQVIDCAMTDGAALLSSMTWALYGAGKWRDERGVNMLDSGAHFYDVYETADHQYVSVGAIEPQFYALLLNRLGLSDDEAFADQLNPEAWPGLKQKLASVFASRTRAEWCALLEGSDACFAPVLALGEAASHPHNAARGTFMTVGGVVQPRPAPLFSGTPSPPPKPPDAPLRDTDALLAEIGIGETQRAVLRKTGVVG